MGENIMQTGVTRQGVRNEDLYGGSNNNDIDVGAIVNSLSPRKFVSAETANFDSSFFGTRPSANQSTSKYDDKINMWAPDDAAAIQTNRARSQGALLQGLNGLTKATVLAGTTFVGGTAGLIMGIGQWIGGGFDESREGENHWERMRGSDFWNNDLQKILTKIEDWSEEAMPVYKTNKAVNGAWYENIFSTDNFMAYFADDFVKNIGFSVGAAYSGMAATPMLNLIAKLGGSTIGANLFSRMIVGSVVSAFGEGSIESKHAAQEFIDEHRPLLEQDRDARFAEIDSDGWMERYSADAQAAYQEELAGIENEYKNSPKTFSRSNDGRMVNDAEQKRIADINALNKKYANMLQNARTEAKLKVQEDFDAAMKRVETDAVGVGNKTLGWNMALLTWGNFKMFGKLYAGGFKPVKEGIEFANTATKNMKKGMATQKDVWDVMGPFERVKKSGPVEFIKKNGLKNMIIEGNEEGGQFIGAAVNKKYYGENLMNWYATQTDPWAAERSYSYLNAVADGFSESINDPNFWLEYTIGGLTGILGVPIVRKKRGSNKLGLTMAGGIMEARREYREENERQDKIVETLNKYLQDPAVRSQIEAIGRVEFLEQLQELSIKQRDEMQFKDAEFGKMFSVISAFHDAGRMQDLYTIMEMLDSTQEVNSKEYLEQVYNAFQKVESVEDQKAAIQEQINDISENLIKNGQNMSADKIQELSEKIQELQNEMGSITDPKESGPFTGYNINTQADRDKIKAFIEKNTNRVKDYIQYYNEAQQWVNDFFGHLLPPEKANYLAYLKGMTKDWEGRVEKMLPNVMKVAKHMVNEWAEKKAKALDDFSRWEAVYNSLSEDEKKAKKEEYETRKSNLEFADKMYELFQKIQSMKPKDLVAKVLSLKDTEMEELFGSVYNFVSTTPEAEIDNILEGDDFSKQVLQKLVDIQRIKNNYNHFLYTMYKYLNNIDSLSQEIERGKKKAEVEKKATENQELYERFKNSKLQDEFTDEELLAITNKINDPLTDPALKEALEKVLNERNLFQRRYQRLKKILEEKLNNGQMTKFLYDNEIAKIERAYKESKTADDLLDINNPVYQDKDDLDLGNTTGMTQDQIDDLKERMSDQIKTDINEAIEEVKRLESNNPGPQPTPPGPQPTPTPPGPQPGPQPGPTPPGPTPQPGPAPQNLTINEIMEKKTPILPVYVNRLREQLTDEQKKELDRFLDVAMDDNFTVDDVEAWVMGNDTLFELYDSNSNPGKNFRTLVKMIESIKEGNFGGKALFINDNNTIDVLDETSIQGGGQVKQKEVVDTIPTIDPVAVDEIDKEAEERKKKIQEENHDDGKNPWKPTTTLYPIHRDQNDPNGYVVNADGTMRPKYWWEITNGANKTRLQTIHTFLKERGVFNRKQWFDPAKGPEVTFAVSKELTEKAGGEKVILIINSSGEIIGDLPSSREGLEDIHKAAEEQFEAKKETTSEDLIPIDGFTTKIAKIMIGKPQYTPKGKRATLNQIMSENGSTVPFDIGIAMTTGTHVQLYTAPTGHAKETELSRNTMNPLTGRAGQPFLLLPTSDQMGNRKYLPVPITWSNFEGVGKGTKFYEIISTIAKRLDNPNIDLNNQKSILAIKDALAELLDIGENKSNFSYDKNTGDLKVRIGGYTYVLKGDNKGEQLVEALSKSAVNIRFANKYINSTYKFKGEELSYNEILGEIANTNMEVGANHTIDDWFVLDPIVNGQSRPANPQPQPQNRPNNPVNKPGGKKVIAYFQQNGVQYELDEDYELSMTIMATGVKTALTGDRWNLTKAYMWAHANNPKKLNWVKTPWGWYDIAKAKFTTEPKPEKPKGQGLAAVVIKARKKAFDGQSRHIKDAPDGSSVYWSYAVEDDGTVVATITNIKDGESVANSELPIIDGIPVWKMVLGTDRNTYIYPMGLTSPIVATNPNIKKYISREAGNDSVVTGKLGTPTKEELDEINAKIEAAINRGKETLPQRLAREAQEKFLAKPEIKIKDDAGNTIGTMKFEVNDGNIELVGVKGMGNIAKIQRTSKGKAVAFDENGNEVSLTEEQERAIATTLLAANAKVTEFKAGSIEGLAYTPEAKKEEPKKAEPEKKKEEKKGKKNGLSKKINKAKEDANSAIQKVEDFIKNTSNSFKLGTIDKYFKLLTNEFDDVQNAIVELQDNFEEDSNEYNELEALLNSLEEVEERAWDELLIMAREKASGFLRASEERLLTKAELKELSKLEKEVLDNFGSEGTEEFSDIVNKTNKNQINREQEEAQKKTTTKTPEEKEKETTEGLQKAEEAKQAELEKARERAYDKIGISNLNSDNLQAKLDKVEISPSLALVISNADEFDIEALVNDMKLLSYDASAEEVKGVIDSWYEALPNESNESNKPAPFREVDEALYEEGDMEKEIAKVMKMFPTLSRDQAVQLTEKMIESIDNSGQPVVAWGRFRNGIITIYNKASRGTAYHEAYHYASQMLMTSEELNTAYSEARKLWGDMDVAELEEKLAEAFRMYMQDYEDKGFFGKVWSNMKHYLKAFRGNVGYLDSLFFSMRKGSFARKRAAMLKNVDLNSGINKFNIGAIDTSKVDIEEVDKPWRSDSSKSNKTLRIYLKGQKEKGYFELVKDNEDGYYSVHFKTNTGKFGLESTSATTKEERAVLYEQLINAIPAGAKVSTWGEISKGGIVGLNKVGSKMSKVGERTIKSKETGEQVNVPIFEKQGFNRVIGQQGAARLSEDNIKRLELARKMRDSYVDPHVIKVATGWETGVDGQWRFERPDFKYKKKGLTKFTNEYGETRLAAKATKTSTGIYTVKLADIIDDKKLFKEYPGLQNATIVLNEFMSESNPRLRGSFASGTTVINISARALRMNTGNGYIYMKYENPYRAKLKEIVGINQQIVEAKSKFGKESMEYRSLMDELSAKMNEIAEFDKYEREVVVDSPAFTATLIHELQHYIQEKESFINGASADNPSYMQVGGEVEARNASRRSNNAANKSRMSAKERKGSLLYETSEFGKGEYVSYDGVRADDSYLEMLKASVQMVEKMIEDTQSSMPKSLDETFYDLEMLLAANIDEVMPYEGGLIVTGEYANFGIEDWMITGEDANTGLKYISYDTLKIQRDAEIKAINEKLDKYHLSLFKVNDRIANLNYEAAYWYERGQNKTRFLSKADWDYITEKGISREEYLSKSKAEREQDLKC
jgi:hypothetical protein